MSSLIDERTVQMNFDNKNFERNVKTSMNTLDGLKSSMDFTGVSNSLNKSFGSMDTSTLTKSLGKAAEGFTTMEVAAIAAIANITNRVVNLGLQIAKSLSVDNISDGWVKYGEKTKSVGTLMAQTIKDSNGNIVEGAEKTELINKNLEKLMWYADETSYSFNDMLSSVTKFTATGVDLDSAVDALMGSANWAALSGQNAATASRAMYQLSQAMSVGSMKLIDWRSIQNANMDTQEFRQNALDTAVAMGELQRTIEGSYITKGGKEFGIGEFKNFLSEGWFTSDVLLKTLQEYGGAIQTVYDTVQDNDDIKTAAGAFEVLEGTLDPFQEKAFKAAQEARTLQDAMAAIKETVASAYTGMAESVFGTYEQAKTVWTNLVTEMYDLFVKNLVVKQQIVDAWNGLGGRNDLFDRTEGDNGAFWNLLQAIKEIQSLIRKSWQTIFPMSELEEGDERISDIAGKIKKFTENLKEASKKLLLTSDKAEILGNIFKGIFSILKIFTNTIGALWKGFQPIISLIPKALSITTYLLSEVGKKITDVVSSTKIFDIVANKISSTLVILIEALKDIFAPVVNLIKSFITIAKPIQTVTDALEPVIKVTEAVTSGTKALVGANDELMVGVKKLTKPVILASDVINRASTEINDVLNVTKEVIKPVDKVHKTIKDINKKGSLDRLANAAEYVSGGIDGVKTAVTDVAKPISRFGKIVLGLKAAVEIILEVGTVLFKTFNNYIWPALKKGIMFLGGLVFKFINGLIDLLVWVSGLIVRLNEWIKTNDSVQKGMDKLVSFFQSIPSSLAPITKFFTKMIKGISNGTTTLLASIKELFAGMRKSDTNAAGEFSDEVTSKLTPLQTFLKGMASLLRGIMSVIKAVIPTILKLFGYIGEVIGKIGDALAKVFSGDEGLFKISDLFDVAFWSVIIYKFSQLSLYIGKLSGVLRETLDSIGGSFADFGEGIKFKYMGEALQSLAVSLLIIVAALVLIASVDEKEMSKALSTLGIITGMLLILGTTMFKMVSVSKGLGLKSLAAAYSLKMVSEALISMAAAVAIMAGVAIILGKMDQKEMINGILGITILLGMLVSTAKTIGSAKGNISKGTGSLIKMSIAVAILGSTLRKIGKMNASELMKGIVGISALVALSLIFAKVSSSVKRANRTALALISFSIALSIAAIPLKTIGKMSWEEIGRGLVGMVGAAGIMVGLSLLSKYVKKAALTALGLISISIGLATFAGSISVLGSLQWMSLLKAAGALIILAGVIFGVSKLVGNPKILASMALFGLALTALSQGLIAFGIAMKVLGTVNGKDMWAAIRVIVLVLAGTSLLSGVLGVISPLIFLFGKALITLSIGLIAFAVAIRMLGSIEWGTLGKGLLVIVGLMVILGVASKLLAPLIPTMFALSGALLLFSVAALLIAVAVTLVVAALATFGTVAGVAAIAVVSALDKLVDGLITMMPKLGTAMELLLMTILGALELALPRILELLGVAALGIAKFLTEQAPVLIEAVVTLIDELLKSLAAKMPSIASNLVSMIVTLLTALKERMREIITIVLDIVMEILMALQLKLPEIIRMVGETIMVLIESIVATIVSLVPRLITAAFDLVLGIIEGLGIAIRDNAARVREVMVEFCKNLWRAFLNFFGIHSPSKLFFEAAGNMVKGLINGIGKGISGAAKAVKNFAVKIFNGIKDKWKDWKEKGKEFATNLGEGIQSKWQSVKSWVSTNASKLKEKWGTWKETGKNLMQGFSEGISSAYNNVKDAVSTTADKVSTWFKDFFGIHSPSRLFAEYGMYLDQGLAKGMEDNTDDIIDSAEKAGQGAVDGVEKAGIDSAMAKLYESLNADLDGDIVIRPVMDLSDIQNGTNKLNSIMDNVDDFTVEGSTRKATDIYNSMKFKESRNAKSGNTNKNETNGIEQGGSGDNISMVFNISGSNPKEIAKQVSQEISNQMNRKRAAFAQ